MKNINDEIKRLLKQKESVEEIEKENVVLANSESKKLLSDLKKIGIDVSDYRLVNIKGEEKLAPKLVGLLWGIKADKLMGDFINVLSQKYNLGEVDIYPELLFDGYKKLDSKFSYSKTRILNIMYENYNFWMDNAVMEFIATEKDVQVRLNLYNILSKSRAQKVEIFLLDMLKKDQQMAQQIIYDLGCMHSKRSLPLIKPYLTHKDSWIRAEAKKAIAKIESNS